MAPPPILVTVAVPLHIPKQVILVAEIVETRVILGTMEYTKQLEQFKESFIHIVCEPADSAVNVKEVPGTRLNAPPSIAYKYAGNPPTTNGVPPEPLLIIEPLFIPKQEALVIDGASPIGVG